MCYAPVVDKDFREWHALKTALERHRRRPFFSEREIWISSIGLNLGHEEDGKGDRFLRPVIVFKKFSPDLFWGIPLTTTDKRDPFHLHFSFNRRDNAAILSQLRAFDRRRLLRRMGIMPEEAFLEVAARIGEMAKIETPR